MSTPIWRTMWLLALTLTLADFIYPRHALSELEHLPAIYVLAGALSPLLIISLAAVLQWLSKLTGAGDD